VVLERRMNQRVRNVKQGKERRDTVGWGGGESAEGGGGTTKRTHRVDCRVPSGGEGKGGRRAG